MAQTTWSPALLNAVKNSSQAPTDEEMLQQLINAGAMPTAPAPVAKAPVKRAPAPAAPRAAAPAAPQAPAQQANPGDPYQASPGTVRLPFQDQLTEDQQKEIALKQRAYFLDPTEMAARYKGIEGMPAIQDLKKGNQNYKDMIAMEAAQGGQTDLSGLMALADVASDNRFNMRGGYKAPGDKAKELLANMDKAQDNSRDLTKEIIALSNSGKAGMDTSTIQSLLLSKLSDGFKTAPPARTGGGSEINNYAKWTKDPILKWFDKNDVQAADINELAGMVSSNNPIDLNRLKVKRAAADNKGRPNIVELGLESDPSIAARGRDLIARVYDGTISNETLAEYRKSVSDLAKLVNDAREQRLAQAKAIARDYHVTDEQVGRRFPKSYHRAAVETQVQAAPTSAREKEMQDLKKQMDDANAIIQKYNGGK